MDFQNNTIAIRHTVVRGTKTLYRKDSAKNDSSNAAMPLPDIIKERLLGWKERQRGYKHIQPIDYVDSGYICTGLNGEPMKPTYISRHFQILLKNIGMPPIRFHDIRHSSAGYLKFLGFDLKDIQTWLRHRDIQTTANLYLKLDMEAKSNIASGLDARLRLLGTR